MDLSGGVLGGILRMVFRAVGSGLIGPVSLPLVSSSATSHRLTYNIRTTIMHTSHHPREDSAAPQR